MAILGIFLRFWVSARYVHNTKCMCISRRRNFKCGFREEKMYTVSEFVNAISPMANIIIPDAASKRFSYGVSNGLRALHDSGKIKLEHIMDQMDMWALYPLKSYSMIQQLHT